MLVKFRHEFIFKFFFYFYYFIFIILVVRICRKAVDNYDNVVMVDEFSRNEYQRDGVQKLLSVFTSSDLYARLLPTLLLTRCFSNSLSSLYVGGDTFSL